MSETKHTPDFGAPWTQDRSWSDTIFIKDCTGQTVVLVHLTRDRTEKRNERETVTIKEDVPYAVEKANLLTAGPALLTALEAFVNAREPIYPSDWLRLKANARAAIAAARGE